MGGNKNAKRVAAVHLYFNLIGTLIFLIGIYTYQHFIGFSFWNSAVDMGGIANFHTIFNVLSTILLFPFIKEIEKLTVITVKDSKKDNENEDDYELELNMLDERITTIPSIAINNARTVVSKMAELANKNFQRTIELLKGFDSKKLERIQEREDMIDKAEEKVTKYLVSLGGNRNLSKNENASINSLIRIDSEIEKIGDYCYRLAKTIEHMNENDIKMSETANKSLEIMSSLTEEAVTKTIEFLNTRRIELSVDIQVLKEVTEIKREKCRTEHILRLKKGICNVDSGIAYLEILTVLEKIVDHCYNTSIALSNYVTKERFITKQDYVKRMYKNRSIMIKERLQEYSLKYEI